MRGYYSADQVRAAEAELFRRVPDGDPMRRAAHGLARVVAGELAVRTGGVSGRAVTLLVGSGDNGGDALFAGAALRRRGVAVTAVLLTPGKVHRAGLAALRRAGGRVAAEPGRYDLVVDGIVGISGRGPLRPAAAALVAELTAPVVAADLPSGVDPDTGAVTGPHVQAAVTVTFGAYKPVHVLAAPVCGRVELVPIGLDLETAPAPVLASPTPAEVGAAWPLPGPTDDKYSQGVTGIVAGSSRFPGAAVLCTGAAVAATSGLVRYVGPAVGPVLSHRPEVVAVERLSDAGRAQAWVVGPGAGTDAAAHDRLAELLDTDVPVLVDADGLTVLAADPDLLRGRTAPTLLTPHAGEFVRLTGTEPGADRVSAVRRAADDLGATVLLKGRATVIAAPGESPVLVNEAGSSWAATAGSGDVLSGLVGALLAAGIEPPRAAAMGARAHALAAALAARGDGPGWAPIGASALLAQVPAALRVLWQYRQA
ncbi:NAD(P)H-hydrate dehydratase [Skermania piniformis]|uniref:ADP-dependent (S)-NAD(P)H-hydrate dehydratase n=1 Tax=Skermania pinensis TaxID=39122 RepID=A0ABX8SB13_9ACTN|nr:NAD(P)H-hydrate dehydratase [Skermania piniformis]QXQ14636.1 NAD(P)H-hydrate dehydratase [Skermania piniformis]